MVNAEIKEPKPVLRKAKKQTEKQQRTSQKAQDSKAMWTSGCGHDGGGKKGKAGWKAI